MAVIINCAFGVVVLIVGLIASSVSANDLDEHHSDLDEHDASSPEAIRTKLLQDYHVQISPPKIDGLATKIEIGIDVHHFELDEVEQTFVVNAWLNLAWNDSRLMWNVSNGARKDLRFGDTEIWKPDITLYNNAYPTDVEHYGTTFLIVKSDGSVNWVPPARLAVPCRLNLIRWPYDTHTCSLVLGSWTHSGEDVDLEWMYGDTNSSEKISLPMPGQYIDNSEWSIIKSEGTRTAKYYPCCPEPYVDVTFSFTIQRSSPSYVVCVILPICIVAIVNIMVFILPPTSGEKLTLSAVNLFIICIFLIYFEAKLPSLGDHLPLLVLLYACNLVLVAISIVISVVVLNLSRTRRPSSPPQCFRLFCNVNFAQMLGLGYLVPFISHTHSRLEEGVEMRAPRGSNQNRLDVNPEKEDQRASLIDYETPYMSNAEWILLASMIDRLSFIVYAVVTGIILGLCLA